MTKRTSRWVKRASRRNPPEIKIKGTKVYVDGEHTATIIGSRSRITSGRDAGGVAPHSGYGIRYVGEDTHAAFERQAIGAGYQRHLPYSYFKEVARRIRDGAIPARMPQPNRRKRTSRRR